ncbi:hypothetical protein [Bradyrhizobium prioriisuperbiae]|uniref:hypothetical protein n=1 Tax=Bradyrhizobium prioriisuperbiae TaxID=2854389 RepID=UPI0028E93338|nr:hypothetical protein [Bradyrhizobium prioritasuperba]
MSNVATIITPLDPNHVETCRQYLRANADPNPDFAQGRLQCKPLFQFDRIKTLHFCSFVILDAEANFGPSLVFEATFDGARADFLRELLRVAPDGLHELYKHCIGYPALGLVSPETTAPELIREYLERYDVGANTFFSGYPGRSAAQVRDENAIHSGIVTFLGDRWRAAQALPGRLVGFFDSIRDEFIRGRPENRWAAEPAQLPWEVTARDATAWVATAVIALLAWAIGALVGRLMPALRPNSLYDDITGGVDAAGQTGVGIARAIGAVLPWMGGFIDALQPALPGLIGGTVIWVIVRGLELFLSDLTRNPRDQSFILRFPFQLAVVFRYALVLFMAGSVLRVIVSGLENRSPSYEPDLVAVLVIALTLLICGVVLFALQHWANTLRLAVELKPFGLRRERSRRALLDIIQLAMVLTCAIGLLIVVRQTAWLALSHEGAQTLRALIWLGFKGLFYVVLGTLAGYAAALLLFGVIWVLEWRDKRSFADPSGLIERAQINARKYAREEGGINTFQNHLASITYVKPGLVRWLLVWLALAAVNLLARFWFNRGELGGIPTIMSARWVLIDRGRRLLFLDNFGGAWESYLNEFIDLAAVKGLNAIWTNTFVHAAGRRFGFPATDLLFWQGAQAEQPFKAYVRQSQIETLAWYSAYPTLSVVNVNANTDLRQALSRELTSCEIDTVFQRL